MMNYRESIFNIWKQNNNRYYLVNTFCKSVALIEEETYDKIKQVKLTAIPTETMQALVANGFLVDSSLDELALLHYKYKQAYFVSDYLFVTLIFTMRCNFKCPYCFETQKQECITPTRLNALKSFSEKEFKKKKLIHLTFFGGEPLLEFESTANYLDFVNALKHKYNFRYDIGITTNGYQLNKLTVDRLVDQYNAVTFQVTIDGYEKSHDNTRMLLNGSQTYATVLHNFKYIIEKSKSVKGKLDPSLRVNLLNNSIEDINTLLNEFSDNEKPYFRLYFRPVYNTSRFCVTNENRNNLESFYKIAKDRGFRVETIDHITFHYCEGDSGLNAIQIMPDLSVWKCMNDTNFSGAKIGEINNEGELILNYRNIEKWSRNDPFNDKECQKCKMLPLCWGGCPLFLAKTGKRNCLYEKDFDVVNLFLKSS